MTRIQRAFAIGLGVGLLLGVVTLVAAEQQRAGLVIQFGDGRVITACVDLGADGQATGEEVLSAAGLPVVIEYSGVGGAVCQINSEGCAFPGEPCFCQCTLRPGESCRYWSYSRLVDGRWQYSQIGAGSVTVRAGDVEGWAWGEGVTGSGAQPPVRTFDDVCAPTPATETPSATTTPAGTATATPGATTRPTSTALPTARPALATPPPLIPAATFTPAPTAPSATVASPPPIDVPTPLPQPSSTPPFTSVAVVPTVAPAAPAANVSAAASTPAGSREQYAPLVLGGESRASATAAGEDDVAGAPAPRSPVPPAATPAPPVATIAVSASAHAAPDVTAGYGTFAALAGLLSGMWAWLTWRRRR